MDNQLKNAWAVVTGASKNIGYALTVALLERQYHLVLIARNLQKVLSLQDKYPHLKIIFLELDLSLEENWKKVQTKIAPLPIALFINNAAIAHYDYFQTRKINEIDKLVNLNMKSVVALSYNIIKNHSQAILVNVASFAVSQPVGFLLADYYLSKKFVAFFTKALMYEYPQQKIKILYPGYFITDLLNIQQLSPKQEAKQKQRLLLFSHKVIVKILNSKRKEIVIFRKDRW